ncbi:hypothetical protein PAMC26577_11485 [Caballeronia sordidicola]|uniref:Uncharacterized protein n=1 Tax=Caballeronia sordidicola TaxID=196367 RepID=A0A242MXW6_CABSO|nr:hypothetical protein PAMC26577_11485 [Caballeronia sordidicola]
MQAVATFHDVDLSQSDINISQLTISPKSAIGRQADPARDQFAHDLAQARAARKDGMRQD